MVAQRAKRSAAAAGRRSGRSCGWPPQARPTTPSHTPVGAESKAGSRRSARSRALAPSPASPLRSCAAARPPSMLRSRGARKEARVWQAAIGREQSVRPSSGQAAHDVLRLLRHPHRMTVSKNETVVLRSKSSLPSTQLRPLQQRRRQRSLALSLAGVLASRCWCCCPCAAQAERRPPAAVGRRPGRAGASPGSLLKLGVQAHDLQRGQRVHNADAHA